MVNFEGGGCSFSQRGGSTASLPPLCSPLHTARRYDARLSTGCPGSPSGQPRIACFSRGVPRTRAFAMMPRHAGWDLQNGISSLLFPACTAALPPLLFLSFLFLSLFLCIFSCVHCRSQQLLNCTYLGSPLTCCLLELHTMSRDVGQNQSSHLPNSWGARAPHRGPGGLPPHSLSLHSHPQLKSYVSYQADYISFTTVRFQIQFGILVEKDSTKFTYQLSGYLNVNL